MLAFGFVLFMPIIATAYLWIEQRAEVPLLIFAVIALAMLIAAYVPFGLLVLWHLAQEGPFWATCLFAAIKIVIAAALIRGFVLAVRRLRAVLAARDADAG
jgi:hypothetical protein